MLDLKYIKENYEEAAQAILNRQPEGAGREKLAESLSRVIVLDQERRNFILNTEKLQKDRNDLSKQVGMKKRNGEDASELQVQVQNIKQEFDSLNQKLEAIQSELNLILAGLPNIPDASVPIGWSEDDNQEVRRWGTPAELAFAAKQHFEVAEELGILDLERAAKLAGSRFSLLSGPGALLERALSSLMLDLHTIENGYTEIAPPFIVSGETMYASGQLPKFEEDLFKLNHAKDMYLIPTAEVPLVNLHAKERLEEADLPKKYTALTPCFRSEAGSYGKDTRGIIRVHQFNKVEMVNLTNANGSEAALEEMVGNAERILQLLEIPYRVMVLCTGDMGFSATKTYDIEVWLPGQNAYREISSCSNCKDFQGRRANIRYRPTEKGKPQFVHTLNGSGLAVGRTWIAVLENYQQADGSVVIPKVLRKYMGDCELITATGLK